MAGSHPARSRLRTVGFVAATYAAWLVACLAGAAAFVTWHTALLRLYIGLRLDRWSGAAFNDALVILLGLLWLVGVVAAEGWFRAARDGRALARRFGRLTAIEVALILLGFAVGRLA